MKLFKKKENLGILVASAIIILISIMLTQPSSAFTMNSYSFQLTEFLTEGGDTSSNSYISTFSFAQPIVGWTSGGPYKICLGIYCTEAFEGDYEVPINGNLKYGNRTAVVNSEIKAIIGYKNHNFEKTTITDSQGNFDVVVRIPEFVYDKAFTVKIYAYGEIEALYECEYNPATEECS